MKALSCVDGSVIKKSVQCFRCGVNQYGHRVSYIMNDSERGLFPMTPKDKLFNFGVGYDSEKPLCYRCWSFPDMIRSKKYKKRLNK